MQALVVVALEHAHGVREDVGIPGEIAPVEALHPVAVEVEDGEGNVPLRHAVDEGGGGVLVIIGGEGGGQPQAEAPRGQQCRTAGQGSVQVQGALGITAVDHVIDQRFTLMGELDALHLLAGDLEAHVARILHQHAVAAVGHVEGDVLVGQLGGRAAVSVPHVDHLAVLDVRTEALAQAVDAFTHVQLEGIAHVGGAVGQEGAIGAVLGQGPAHAAPAGGGQHMIAHHVFHLPLTGRLADAGGQIAGGEGGILAVLGHHGGDVLLIGLELRLAHLRAGKVGDLDPDDVLAGRGEGNRQ